MRRETCRAQAIAVVLCCAGLLSLAPLAAARSNGTDWQAVYDARTREYLDLAVHDTSLGSPGLFTQIARLELGAGPLDAGVIEERLDFIDARKDTADFSVTGLVRILYDHGASPLLSPDLRERIEQTLLRFKYWIDEPGSDGMVYWSENHQILFASSEYLLGQLYPDRVFANSGLTGAEHMAKARPRILRWLEDRFLWGFSEWHSNVYYDEDLAPLVNLVDFCADPEIAVRAAMIVDVLLYEIAVNTHGGVFGVSHGRTYPRHVLGARREATASLAKLVTGKGAHNSRGQMSAISLATSSLYRPPSVLLEIGAHEPEGGVFKERMGARIEQPWRYGRSHSDPASVMFWWGMGAYADWRVVDLTFRVADTYGLFASSEFFKPFAYAVPLWKSGLLSEMSQALSPVTSGSVLSEVNTYAYRTPEYMLASAQNFRPGQLGAQTHIWQATLDRDAVVFTHHAATDNTSSNGSYWTYWTGGWLPKLFQHRNVLVAIYNINPILSLVPDLYLPYSHAYFPKQHFDEVRSSGKWTFGRKGDAYVGLYSEATPRWRTDGEWADAELLADGTRNAWICELGRKSEHGSFDHFVAALEQAKIEIWQTVVRYRSPSVGLMEVTIDDRLRIGGSPVRVHDYPRFDNPYGTWDFESPTADLWYGDSGLYLDFESGERTLSPPATPTVRTR
jgi:hypothetical protein